jgi:hypothetical protein
MHSIAFHPSPTPPVSTSDLERYADQWVVVRGGKVVLRASTYDALTEKRRSGGFKDGDRLLHLPPVAPV